MNCATCGHDNVDGAHFCAECGSQLTTEEAQANWIGKIVGGRFKVTRVLGEGGMGVVYEGEQQMGNTVRRVAIKTLHQHLSKDASVLARFQRECGTVAQLEHPNTIKFYDFGREDDGTLYIAMEFLDGHSLDKIISEEGCLTPARVVKILSQVCGALDEAHDQGVIHRDLKPENVVLGERLGNPDFVKVLDFGIAARTESSDAQAEAKLTQQGMVLGTPPYMSPEQFTGVELDRRSDVYSLGVMTYEMLTGQLPFSANTAWQWATEHMTSQPYPIDQRPTGAAVPPGMRATVMQALEKDPDARPGTAGAFFRELEKGLSGAAAAGTAHTQAMQAPPIFSASAPEQSPRPDTAGLPTDTQSEMSATQPIAVPVKKGGSGLVVAALIGFVALGAGALALSGSDETSDVEDGPDAAASANSKEEDPKAFVQEEDPTQTEKGPEPAPDPSPASGSKPAPNHSPAPAPTTKPLPQTNPSPTPTPQPTAKPVPSTPSEPKECTQCSSLLAGGAWQRVAANFSQCQPGSRSSCSSAAKRLAEGAVKSAVKNRKCSYARSIISAAGTMGVSTSTLQRLASRCRD